MCAVEELLLVVGVKLCLSVLSSKVLVLCKGKIDRIRGVAWGMRVSPSVAKRVVESAKG